jgi:hypothetical protein
MTIETAYREHMIMLAFYEAYWRNSPEYKRTHEQDPTSEAERIPAMAGRATDKRGRPTDAEVASGHDS